MKYCGKLLKIFRVVKLHDYVYIFQMFTLDVMWRMNWRGNKRDRMLLRWSMKRKKILN